MVLNHPENSQTKKVGVLEPLDGFKKPKPDFHDIKNMEVLDN